MQDLYHTSENDARRYRHGPQYLHVIVCRRARTLTQAEAEPQPPAPKQPKSRELEEPRKSQTPTQEPRAPLRRGPPSESAESRYSQTSTRRNDGPTSGSYGESDSTMGIARKVCTCSVLIIAYLYTD